MLSWKKFWPYLASDFDMFKRSIKQKVAFAFDSHTGGQFYFFWRHHLNTSETVISWKRNWRTNRRSAVSKEQQVKSYTLTKVGRNTNDFNKNQLSFRPPMASHKTNGLSFWKQWRKFTAEYSADFECFVFWNRHTNGQTKR